MDVVLADGHDSRMRDAAFSGDRVEGLVDLGNDANAMDWEAPADGAFDGGRDREQAEPCLVEFNQEGLIGEFTHDRGCLRRNRQDGDQTNGYHRR